MYTYKCTNIFVTIKCLTVKINFKYMLIVGVEIIFPISRLR